MRRRRFFAVAMAPLLSKFKGVFGETDDCEMYNCSFCDEDNSYFRLIYDDGSSGDDFSNKKRVPGKDFGIGIEFHKNGKHGRVAVRIPNNPNPDIFHKAWKKLSWAASNPEDPGAKARWGTEQLKDYELQLSDYA